MAKITQEEIKKLAHIACIEIDDHEIGQLMREIEAVLTCASGLKDVAARYTQGIPLPKNINIFRADSVEPSNPGPLLALAPEREGDYFVVPVIIGGTQDNQEGN